MPATSPPRPAPRARTATPILGVFSLAAACAVIWILARPSPLRSLPTVAGDFTNFEALQTRPLALTPDGTKLLAVNTPDARLEVFAVGAGSLTSLGEIRVGLEPVSVAAYDNDLAWVVNRVSDDVSIVSLSTLSVRATFRAGDEPADVVFAGTPRRGFVCVSGEDAVKVYDPAPDPADPPTLAMLVPVFARHPRALAARGAEVYVAALDAGNRTTALSAGEVLAGGGPPAPNPPMSPALPAPPDVGLIVQKVGSDWVDERPAAVKTWNATVPYDLPDHDVTVIDAGSGGVIRTISDLGTSLFDIAVAPGSGNLYVTNTEAFNRTRFLPNLRGRFLHNRVTRIGSGGLGSIVPWHLNSHITYDTLPGPPGEKDLSLSQPVGVVVDANETKVYVAALGSDKVGVVDPASGAVTRRIGTSLAPRTMRNGPTGLVLDGARGQLFVLNRFSNSIAVIDVTSETCVAERALGAPNANPTQGFDPSPPEVLEGRRFLYDATLSEHGDLSCASCHIGADFDNIAWDLGDPQGAPEPVPPGQPPSLPPFHPMKGPMTTQTLRGLRDLSPFHWRGDRVDFRRFNPAFVALMGNDDSLSSADMAKYEDFIMTVVFPPNPNQNLDRTFPDPPSGPSAERGRNEFLNMPHEDGGGTCVNCHAMPTGTIRLIVPGPVLQESQGFKVPHLRNMYRKDGFTDGPGPQKRGFGVLHDGSIDGLLSFLRLPVFQFASDAERRDLEAFLMSFDTGTAPSVGRQLTIDASTKDLGATVAQLDSLYDQADAGNCDLIAHGLIDGSRRSYVYRGGRLFESDLDPEGVPDADDLRALVSGPEDRLTYLGVPVAAGERMGIDRDRDGYKDRWEALLGSNPADPNSTPLVTAAAPPSAAPPTRLLQNAPNPFNPMTSIPFELGTAGRVRLHVFDASGRLVRTLVDREMPAGAHHARWDGRDDRGRPAGSGRYYYRLRAAGRVLARDMTLVK